MRTGRLFIVIIFIAAAILLAGSMVSVYQVGLTVIRAEGKMENQLLVLDQVQDFGSTLKDAETGQRGFLLTGDEGYLFPYQHALTDLGTELGALRRLVSTG